MSRVGDDTVASIERREHGPGERVLLVVGEGRLSTHPLPLGAQLAIGRDAACDVVLDHPRVSRRHAVVHAGATAQVEDTGGTNRVRVGERRLNPGQRVPLSDGAGFQVGPFTVVVLGVPSSIGESIEGHAALVVRDVGALSDLIARVAASDVSVLVRGETGVGKEMLARALHARSGRTGPFLAINCAALSESLLESELFGYERGAFTGAVQAKPGLFESAAGGTVFLDEIGDMPPGVQAKLLRAVESRQVLRVGGVRPIELDVRFLAATHRDLRAAVVAGQFRQDLYFRINGITVVVPPLRERSDHIPALVGEILAAAAARSRGPAPRLGAEAMARLVRHDWPGNVRELKTVVERALLLAGDDEIATRHIVLDPPTAAAAASAPPPADDERARIIAALDQCAGNQTRAARLLQMSRATLASKLSIHRIPRPRKS